MNKSDISDILAEQGGLAKSAASRIVSEVFSIIESGLADDGRVSISNFGTFRVCQRKGFVGFNPKTRKRLVIEPKFIPVFRSGKRLKSALNEDK